MIGSFIPITVGSAVAFQCFNSALDFDFLPPPPGKYAGTDRHRWRNATTSLVNSVIMSCAVLYCLFNHPELWNEPETYYVVAVDVCFATVSGYLIYDTRDLMTHSHISTVWWIVVHHIILFSSFIIMSMEQKAMGIMTIGLLSEVSAIFLHSRQLLLMYGFSKRSLLYSVHRFLNLATFLPLRLIPLIYAAYCSYMSRNMPLYMAHVLPFFTTTIVVINIVLLWRLLCSDFLMKDGKDNHVMNN